MLFATSGPPDARQSLLGGVCLSPKPSTIKNSTKSDILVSDTAQSDEPKPSLAKPCKSDGECSSRSVNFLTEVLDISTPMAVNNDDPNDQIIQDFDGEIAQNSLNEFAYDEDNVHLYVNYLLPDRTILAELMKMSWTFPTLFQIINTLSAVTITVPETDNMPAFHFVTAQYLGPMVVDGVPYSAIESTELQLLSGSKTLDLDPLPDQIKHFKFW